MKSHSKTIYPSEHSEQCLLVNTFRTKYKDCIIFAIPNGGNRNRIEAKLLKDEGVTAGVPDLCVLTSNNKTFFIEMKKQKGGVVSSKQKEIIKKFEYLGYPVIIGYGAKDAIEKVEELLNEM